MFEPAHCHVTHSQGATLRSLKVLVTALPFNYELSCFISILLPSVDLGVWLASVPLELLLQGLSYGRHWGSHCSRTGRGGGGGGGKAPNYFLPAKTMCQRLWMCWLSGMASG